MQIGKNILLGIDLYFEFCSNVQMTYNIFHNGGRNKVEFFKVDKRFWREFLDRNLRSRFKSTYFNYDFKVDIDDLGQCWHKQRSQNVST